MTWLDKPLTKRFRFLAILALIVTPGVLVVTSVIYWKISPLDVLLNTDSVTILLLIVFWLSINNRLDKILKILNERD